MACPSRSPGHPLTESQRTELARLRDAGAVSRDDAKGPFATGMKGCNPNVLGALRDKGLADSRVVRAGARGNHGGQYTAY